MQRRPQREFGEEEFLRFAKRYLSDAFPNPRRLDCPPDTDLVGLAEHPKEADPFIPQHLTCCSPCFNRYMELLTFLKREKAG